MKKWLGFALFAGLFLLIQPVIAAPKAELWARWQAHKADASESINHKEWRDWLNKYLVSSANGIHLVNYAAVSQADRQVLNQYLEKLQGVAISEFSRPEQFAFWVNLYNARTVALILEHFPVESITDISFGWFSFGPWDEKLMQVEGEQLSLNDIEHRILRPIWQDNRIHYAVNCASMGCPNLAAQPYTAANYEQLLRQSAEAFVNHPRGVEIKGDKIIASKIYDWYQVDFGGNETALLAHLRKYADADLRQSLQALSEPQFSYQYDWRLNQVAKP